MRKYRFQHREHEGVRSGSDKSLNILPKAASNELRAEDFVLPENGKENPY
jgi:hypothetical protein